MKLKEDLVMVNRLEVGVSPNSPKATLLFRNMKRYVREGALNAYILCTKCDLDFLLFPMSLGSRGSLGPAVGHVYRLNNIVLI